MSKCMNKHICSVSVQHMSVSMVLSALCLPSSVISSSSPVLWSHSCSGRVLRCPLVAGMRGWTHVWIRLSLFLSAACYSSCCCSSGRSRCVYLLCLPPLLPVPLSLQYGSSVWEAAIPLFSRPPFTYRCSCGCWLRSACPTLWKGPAPNHCDTWHLGALSRLRLQLSVSSLPGQSLLHSLLQTAAILLLLVLPVCPPLLHSNQIVEPSIKCLPASLSCHCCYVPCQSCLCIAYHNTAPS